MDCLVSCRVFPVPQEYALFGATLDARMKKDADVAMDSAVFTKLAKECALVSKTCTLADIDLCFSKVRPLVVVCDQHYLRTL